jgi:exopolysaccharide production protein ExoQ
MKEKLLKILSIIVLGLVVFSTHQTILICYLEGMNPPRSCPYGSAEGQLGLLLMIAILTLIAAHMRGEWRAYLATWRKNWFVALYVLLALLSFFWSVYLPATIYRFVLLLSVTAIAAYVGFRFSSRDLVILVAVFAGVAALASLLLAAILPNAAIMSLPPYTGSWRGIFWHKLYLGATMALGCVSYLFILFSAAAQFRLWQKVLAGVMLIVCLALAALSNTVTSYLTFLVQVGLLILVLLWLKLGHLIPKWGRWAIAGCFLVGLIILLANLDLVFGMFNRSTSLTGRIPLWGYLLNTHIATRPILGHGIGAFWLQPGINDSVQAAAGWTHDIKLSDNGYLDILLDLGAVGLFLVLIMLFVAFKRIIQYLFTQRDLLSFYPLFVLIHIVFINISLSYLFEMESFIWFVLIAILFMSAKFSRHGHSTALV